MIQAVFWGIFFPLRGNYVINVTIVVTEKLRVHVFCVKIDLN